MIRQVRLVAVVGALVIGCAVLIVLVGCAGVRSEAPNEQEKQGRAEDTEGQARSPEATASEEARCGKTRTLHRTSYLGPLVTNDVPGCPKGGPLTGTDGSEELHGMEGDDDGFYVLDGRATFYVGEEVHEAGPGTFVFLPHGVPHSYTFETDEVRMLAVVAPGGLEAHFRDPRFAEAAGAPTLPLPSAGPPDAALLEEMAEDLAGYGTEVVGPPARPRGGRLPRLPTILPFHSLG